jgi:hypothetical protein
MNKIEIKFGSPTDISVFDMPAGSIGVITQWPVPCYVGHSVLMTSSDHPPYKRLISLDDPANCWWEDVFKDLVNMRVRLLPKGSVLTLTIL